MGLLAATAITIALILVIGFIVRNVVHRLIGRVVSRAATGSALTGRFRKNSGATDGIDALLNERRNSAPRPWARYSSTSPRSSSSAPPC